MIENYENVFSHIIIKELDNCQLTYQLYNIYVARRLFIMFLIIRLLLIQTEASSCLIINLSICACNNFYFYFSSAITVCATTVDLIINIHKPDHRCK